MRPSPATDCNEPPLAPRLRLVIASALALLAVLAAVVIGWYWRAYAHLSPAESWAAFAWAVLAYVLGIVVSVLGALLLEGRIRRAGAMPPRATTWARWLFRFFWCYLALMTLPLLFALWGFVIWNVLR